MSLSAGPATDGQTVRPDAEREPAEGLASLLVPTVVVRQMRHPDPVTRPRPVEQQLVAGSVASRQLEVLAARECAHEALAQIGRDLPALRRGASGEPLWPADVVGSITHSRGFVAAVVARSDEVDHVGIDAEPWQPLPAGVLPMVASPAEQCRAAARFRDGLVRWELLLFCAKEAAYKAVFPRARRWIDFEEASVSFEEANRFVVRTSAPDLPPRLEGAWEHWDGLALAAVAPRRLLCHHS